MNGQVDNLRSHVVKMYNNPDSIKNMQLHEALLMTEEELEDWILKRYSGIPVLSKELQGPDVPPGQTIDGYPITDKE